MIRKTVLFFISTLGLFAIPVFSGSDLFAQSAPTIDLRDRIRLAEAFRLKDQLSEKIWQDWSKTPLALLLVTPENEFLIGHPFPSKDFNEIGHDKLLKRKVFWRKRVFSSSFLATFPAIEGSGISTIVVGQAENTWVKTSTPWVITLLHENFHQFQDSQENFYKEIADLDLSGGDETGMWMLNYPFPYTDQTINEEFAVLARLLAEALESQGKSEFRAAYNRYLTKRNDLNKSLEPKDYRYLSFQLWKEGTARYIEIVAAKQAAANYRPLEDFAKLEDYKSYADFAKELERRTIESLKSLSLSESKREVVYPFGAGEALLLDKAGISWKNRYFQDKFYLDSYFAAKK